jgi:L-ascorbate metabolism protein UlaG (beta-lactamase superfamily)
VIPEAERQAVHEKLSARWPATHGLTQGESIELDGFRINAVASAHEEVEFDAVGRCRFLGYVIEFGTWTIYHSGDTILYPALVQSLRPFRIDVAILPINGCNPERRVAGNLNPQEAASLAREIGASIVIPCHYEMFTFNTSSVNDFAVAAREVGQRYQVVRCGERWDSLRLVRQP